MLGPLHDDKNRHELIIKSKSTDQKPTTQTMAERPTPHSLVLSTLIVLASLPTAALEDCYVNPTRPGKLGWASGDGRGYEDNDAAHDEDDDDGDGSGENVQVSGRYPSLIPPSSNASAADVRRSTDEREEMWESVREFLVKAVHFGPSSSSSSSSSSQPAAREAGASAARDRKSVV